MNLKDFYSKSHFFLFPLFLLLGFFLFYGWAFKSKEAQIKDALASIKKEQGLINLYLHKLELDGRLKSLMAKFSKETDFKWLMANISESLKKENIEIISIQPLPIKRGDFYKIVALTLHLEGSYNQIARFIAAIDNSDNYLEIGKLALLPKYQKGKNEVLARDGNVLLKCSVKISTIVPNHE